MASDDMAPTGLKASDLRVGDRVRFVHDRSGYGYTITSAKLDCVSTVTDVGWRHITARTDDGESFNASNGDYLDAMEKIEEFPGLAEALTPDPEVMKALASLQDEDKDGVALDRGWTELRAHCVNDWDGILYAVPHAHGVKFGLDATDGVTLDKDRLGHLIEYLSDIQDGMA